jgi:hypothetical protein
MLMNKIHITHCKLVVNQEYLPCSGSYAFSSDEAALRELVHIRDLHGRTLYMLFLKTSSKLFHSPKNPAHQLEYFSLDATG